MKIITLSISACYLFICSLLLPVNICRAQYRSNAQLTGVTSEAPIYDLKQIKYSFRTQGAIRMMPGYSDGVIYVGSGDRNLYALDAATGEQKWKFKTGGAVHCTPTVFNSTVFFNSRDGNLYAVDTKTGKEKWKFSFGKDLEYKNGWDYYLSSPVISEGILYTGSGNGKLYAFSPGDGRKLWEYNVNARIRTGPAVGANFIFTGTMDGHLHAINKKDGTLKWIFKTNGVTNKYEDFGFDATAILSSPSVGNGIVLVGARDGFLYAIDEATGKEKWRVDHEGSWVLGTAIKDGVAFAASGSSGFVQAVDIATGKEKWRYKSARSSFSSLSLAGDMLYFDDYLGNVYAVNNVSGKLAWIFPMGRRSFSGPLLAGGLLYCSSDDGVLYALEPGNVKAFKEHQAPKKMVYWEAPKSEKSYTWFQNGVDLYIKGFFKNAGYTLIDGEGLKQFLKEQITNAEPSVVVFAVNELPAGLSDYSRNSLLRKYLDKGGKIVFLGPDPTAFRTNATIGIVTDSIDFTFGPKQIFDVRYKIPGNINMSPLYQSDITEDGKKWGLQNGFVGYSSDVEYGGFTTILATDEYGNASAWVKSFGGKRGTGLMLLGLPRDVVTDLQPIRIAVEYGLEW